MRISDKITELRESHQMTVAELADKMLVSEKVLNDWEDGSRVPGKYYIEKLSVLFNVSKKEFKSKGLIYRIKLMSKYGFEEWLHIYMGVAAVVFVSAFMYTFAYHSIDTAIKNYKVNNLIVEEHYVNSTYLENKMEVFYKYSSSKLEDTDLEVDMTITWEIPFRELISYNEIVIVDPDEVTIEMNKDLDVLALELRAVKLDSKSYVLEVSFTLADASFNRFGSYETFTPDIPSEENKLTQSSRTDRGKLIILTGDKDE